MPVIAYTVEPVTEKFTEHAIMDTINVGPMKRTPATIKIAVVVGLDMHVANLFAQRHVTTEDVVLRPIGVNVHRLTGATLTAVDYCVPEKHPAFQGCVVFLVPVAVSRDIKAQVRDVFSFQMKITNQKFCIAN